MEPRISIVTLGVGNLDAARKFYREGLGLPVMEPGFPGIAFFTLKGTWLALYPLEELAKDAGVECRTAKFPGMTLAHNVESKAAVDALMKQAEKAGAKITKPAEEKDWGGYSGYFADPDGYLWEVAWNPCFEIR